MVCLCAGVHCFPLKRLSFRACVGLLNDDHTVGCFLSLVKDKNWKRIRLMILVCCWFDRISSFLFPFVLYTRFILYEFSLVIDLSFALVPFSLYPPIYLSIYLCGGQHSRRRCYRHYLIRSSSTHSPFFWYSIIFFLFIYFLSYQRYHHYSGREKNQQQQQQQLKQHRLRKSTSFRCRCSIHILYLQIKQAIWRADLLLIT